MVKVNLSDDFTQPGCAYIIFCVCNTFVLYNRKELVSLVVRGVFSDC